MHNSRGNKLHSLSLEDFYLACSASDDLWLNHLPNRNQPLGNYIFFLVFLGRFNYCWYRQRLPTDLETFFKLSFLVLYSKKQVLKTKLVNPFQLIVSKRKEGSSHCLWWNLVSMDFELEIYLVEIVSSGYYVLYASLSRYICLWITVRIWVANIRIAHFFEWQTFTCYSDPHCAYV